MKTTPTLEQKLKAAEYVYARGYPTAARAEAALYDAMAEGEIAASEKPRLVSYARDNGTRWAIVLTDTALAAYA